MALSDEQFMQWLRDQGIETLRQAERQMNIEGRSVLLKGNERDLIWYIRENGLSCRAILKALQVDVSDST